MPVSLSDTCKGVKAFSLLELLVWLAIISLLCTLSIPATMEYFARQTADSYMQQLRQQLALARVKAITQGYDMLICPKRALQCDGNWQSSPVHIVLLSSPPQVLHQLAELPAGHRLFYNREQLRFRHDGSLNALQNGTFVYCVRHYRWHFKLTLSQAGRSQLSTVSQECPRS